MQANEVDLYLALNPSRPECSNLNPTELQPLAVEPLMLYVTFLVTTQKREAPRAVSFRQLLSTRRARHPIILSNNDIRRKQTISRSGNESLG